MLVSGRIVLGCYSIFVRHWLRFGAKLGENLLLVRLERYSSALRESMTEIFDFLGLRRPDRESWERILKPAVANPSKVKDKARLPFYTLPR